MYRVNLYVFMAHDANGVRERKLHCRNSKNIHVGNVAVTVKGCQVEASRIV